MSIVAASEVGARARGVRHSRVHHHSRRSASFGTHGDEPVRDVMGRWSALRDELRPGGSRLATAAQVHGATISSTSPVGRAGCEATRPTGISPSSAEPALAVTVADCVPVFHRASGGRDRAASLGMAGHRRADRRARDRRVRAARPSRRTSSCSTRARRSAASATR